ncbi:MAG: hypothetical protein MZW92_33595 [Comamonadaceae bacterium]|nr:hypothetical protein [Comamonadaceae bacterium]
MTRRGGRRYLESPDNGWQFQLFVRPRKGDAYRACGRGDAGVGRGRPTDEHRLAARNGRLPARLFREFSVLRGG